MKKYTMKCLLMAVVAVLLTACSTGGKTYRIGVSQCAPGGWRDKINNEMLAAQHLYEQDVKVSMVTSYDDTQQQIHDIDSLVESGIDLLVVAPNEAGPIAKVIDRVKAKGIPSSALTAAWRATTIRLSSVAATWRLATPWE